ncbi:MAG: hypothetical protein IJL66_00490 [Lachnospiraceae bacterium]|nr:hypothetical protein [Lachnospiraceae bacterium]
MISDLFRVIRKHKIVFSAFVLLAAIAISLFLGAGLASKALRRNASDLYDGSTCRDISASSTLLFSDKDLEYIRGLDGVADAEPVWFAPALAELPDVNRSVSVLSLTNRIDVPRTVVGRLPAAPGECALEPSFAEETGLRIGDSLRLFDSPETAAAGLISREFVITGYADHPDHLAGLEDLQTYVLVAPAAFDMEYLNGCFMRAAIAVTREPGEDRFSASYLQKTADVQEHIEALASARTGERDREAKELWDAQAGERRKELAAAETARDSAKRGVDEKIAAFAEAQQSLNETELRLASERGLLEEIRSDLDAASAQCEELGKGLESEKTRLDAEEALLKDSKKKLDATAKELKEAFQLIETEKKSIRETLRQAFLQLIRDPAERSSVHWASSQSPDLGDPTETAQILSLTDTIEIDLARYPKDMIRPIVYTDGVHEGILAALYELTQGTPAPRRLFGEFDLAKIRRVLLSAPTEPAFAGYQRLASASEVWDRGHDTYTSDRIRYQDLLSRHGEELSAYIDSKEEYDSAIREHQGELAAYEERKAAYDLDAENVKQVRDSLAQNRKEINEAQAAYDAALAEYDNSKAKLDALLKTIEKAEPCRWTSEALPGNASYARLRAEFGDIASLGTTSSLLFAAVVAIALFVVSGLFAGSEAALAGSGEGPARRASLAAHPVFGAAAALPGAAIGVLAARYLIQPFLLRRAQQSVALDLTRPMLTGTAQVLLILACAAAAGALVSLLGALILRRGLLKDEDEDEEEYPEEEPENEPEDSPKSEAESAPAGGQDGARESEPDMRPDDFPEGEPVTEPDDGTESVPDTEPEAEPDSDSDNRPEAEPDSDPDNGPEAEPDSGPEKGQDTEPKTETVPAAKPRHRREYALELEQVNAGPDEDFTSENGL